MGKEFADNSTLILQLLAIGILMNSLSLIPNNFFQGIGKPRIPTLINLFEFPIYILLMWYLITIYGIRGAALAFMLMATADALAMYIVAKKMFAIKFESQFSLIIFLSLIFALILPFLINDVIIKTILMVIFISAFISLTWKLFLSMEEKSFFISKLKLKI